MSRFTIFQKFLAEWYRIHKRSNLRWRKKPYDPYHIWVSEIMLQQTQVLRVVDFYKNFIKKFPTIKHLARTTWPQVFSVVRGMGYYLRFRNMRETAKNIIKKYNGKFPNNSEDLRKLPGIGEYTANAILCFAFGKYAPVEDTNIKRIIHRLKFKISAKELEKTANSFLRSPREFFYALMDFGALHLTADHKGCEECQSFFKRNPKISLQRKGRGSTSFRLVAAAIIRHHGKILIQKRGSGHLTNFWEFPGGKVEKGETPRAALKREIKEELGIEVSVRPHFFTTDHAYQKNTVRLTFHRCQILLGRVSPRLGQDWKWVFAHELSQYRFPPADKKVVKAIARHGMLANSKTML